MGVKVGEGGKLYGSITAKDIADALARRGIMVDRHKVDLDEPLKMLGTYKVAIKVFSWPDAGSHDRGRAQGLAPLDPGWVELRSRSRPAHRALPGFQRYQLRLISAGSGLSQPVALTIWHNSGVSDELAQNRVDFGAVCRPRPGDQPVNAAVAEISQDLVDDGATGIYNLAMASANHGKTIRVLALALLVVACVSCTSSVVPTIAPACNAGADAARPRDAGAAHRHVFWAVSVGNGACSRFRTDRTTDRTAGRTTNGTADPASEFSDTQCDAQCHVRWDIPGLAPGYAGHQRQIGGEVARRWFSRG